MSAAGQVVERSPQAWQGANKREHVCASQDGSPNTAPREDEEGGGTGGDAESVKASANLTETSEAGSALAELVALQAKQLEIRINSERLVRPKLRYSQLGCHCTALFASSFSDCFL